MVTQDNTPPQKDTASKSVPKDTATESLPKDTATESLPKDTAAEMPRTSSQDEVPPDDLTAVPPAVDSPPAPARAQSKTTQLLHGRKDILKLVAIPLIVVLVAELLQSEKMTRYLSRFVGSSMLLRIARAAILAIVTGLSLLLFR